ncbi:PP2C family protein-serine/threonine phosphatase [Oceanispirochaeta sp.]|jgi:sigma-B regulation protein RsbU (phosphoserine phosphatase)|uniref:PP2C family protein-serine/threonine phosphatase n=1 Tax=Oceanispirochaeta sp. TaxID=2035350 RepID=UPI00261B38A6|nr:GAF domain-containing SpoIIE family protein phosphatase [Oceanispirochaeta sp.]MDA3955876.1 SpoIIE family protein phosphatase [Oceanispirochaeta sp.]
MKIQTRLGLTSFILIIGFLLSSIFLFSRFTTVYKIKNFQQSCEELNISLSRFTDRNLLLYTDKKYPKIAIDYWMNDLIAVHKGIDNVFKSKLIRRLSPVFQKMMESRWTQWSDIYSLTINPYILELNKFTGSDLAIDGTDAGLYDLYLSKSKINDKSAMKQIELIRDFQISLNHSLDIYHFRIESLTEKLEVEVTQYIRNSITLVISAVTFILLISLIISSQFSRSIVRRVEETNRQVERMTEGTLEFSKDHKNVDEFDVLVQEYHSFSQGLSERLNLLKFLLQDIGNAIGTDTDIESFQETIVELGMDSINADAAMLFLVDSERSELNLVRRTGFCPPPFSLDKRISMVRSNVEEYFESHPLSAETPVFGITMTTGTPLFIKDNVDSEGLPYNAVSDEWLFISSLISLPLIVGKQLMGMLVFYKTQKDKFFSDLDFTFIKAYSDYTAQSIDNVNKYKTLLENREIQKEIDIAAAIQKRLLPSQMPEFSIGRAMIHSRPARGISGDYFDAIRLDEDKILYTVCDVAGKGVPASMLMIMIRTILHSICSRHRSANTLLKELNYHISGRIGVDQYATMAVFVLDEKKKELSYSNAAHHPLYLFRKKEKQFRSFDTEGLPIGVDKNAEFGHKLIRLHDQDYLFLFTDGLPEARSLSGEELSVEQLLRFLAENLDKSPGNLITAVELYIADFAKDARQHDDQTFLALQIQD